MDVKTSDKSFRAGFFGSVSSADRAVRTLLDAGFSKDQLAVIVPEPYRSAFAPDVPRAKRPGSNAGEAVVEGGALGAALGGIALAATALATAGASLLPAIPIFIGGGALAGGFSSLIAADGYGKGVGECFEEAVQKKKIVVGVEVQGAENTYRLQEAERVLLEAGAESLTPSV